jgi:hypothetical protein
MSRFVMLLAAALAVHHPAVAGAQGAPTVAQVGWMAGCWERSAHDFPQRVIYRRRGADSLLARVEGMRGGQLRGLDYPYRR